jgi:beta-fructofuranosidase
MNDPNGVCQVDGRFHLFYQHNPHAPVHGTIHWGHASSVDLFHWCDEPIALAPGPDGPDRDGCYSGVLVMDNDVPTIIYSGIADGRTVPCLATGSRDLRHWTKATPLALFEPPADLDLIGFRDHSVWQDSDGLWHQLVGAGLRGQGGAALQYASDDLRTWRYLGPLIVGDASQSDPIWTGTMWECVDFFPLYGRHVMLFSAWTNDGYTLSSGQAIGTLYMVGDLEGDVFVPERTDYLDHGGTCFYAPQSFWDESGRRILWGWLMEERPVADQQEAGWSGVMGLPRQLSLTDAGLLAVRPVDEVESLVIGTTVHSARPGDDLLLDASRPCRLRIASQADHSYSVQLLADDGPVWIITLDGLSREVVVSRDTDHSGNVTGAKRFAIPVTTDRAVTNLEVYLDNTTLEVFVDSASALSTRIYPGRGPKRISVSSWGDAPVIVGQDDLAPAMAAAREAS